MSNYSSLKATINANVKQNGNQEITGAIMNSVLNAMVDSLGAGYQYKGVATPATNPGTPDYNVFYLASEAGTYTNFGGIVIGDNEVAALVYNGSWSKQTTGAATASEVSQLAQDVADLETLNFNLPSVLYDRDGNPATDSTITSSNGIYLKISNGTTGGGAALATSDYVDVRKFAGLKLKYTGKSSYNTTVAIVCFYTENKTFISGVCQITTPSTPVLIDVPATAYYARYCSEKDTSSHAIDNFSCVGIIPMQSEVLSLDSRVTSVEEAVADIDLDLPSSLYDRYGAEATDSNITTSNGIYLKLATGATATGATYAISPFIDIHSFAGLKLKYKGKSEYSTNLAIVCFYTENKTFISGVSEVTTPSRIVEITIPNTAYYVRYCSGKDTSTHAIDNFSCKVVAPLSLATMLGFEASKTIGENTKNGSIFNKNADNTLAFDALNPILETPGMASIFHDFGFIGDSLSAGEIAYKVTGDDTWKYKDMYPFSWGRRLVDSVAGKCTIYASGGLSTSSWWTKYITNNVAGWSTDGGNSFSSHKHSCYMVALGTNDAHNSTPVGDASTDIDYADYNNNANTFIGNYAKIIQKIREGNAHTPIFCIIYPTDVMDRRYDDAIKSMATLFTGVYIIDIYSSLVAVNVGVSSYVFGGHFTTIGYQWLAWVVANLVDITVRANYAYFQKQALLNEDIDNGTIIW